MISALPKCEGIPGKSSNCVSNTYQRGAWVSWGMKGKTALHWAEQAETKAGI